jgi:hypothetical protein
MRRWWAPLLAVVAVGTVVSGCDPARDNRSAPAASTVPTGSSPSPSLSRPPSPLWTRRTEDIRIDGIADNTSIEPANGFDAGPIGSVEVRGLFILTTRRPNDGYGLVALNVADGSVRWATEVAGRPKCSDVATDDGRLPCLIDGTLRDSGIRLWPDTPGLQFTPTELTMFDLNNGSVVESVSTDYAEDVTVYDGRIVTVGRQMDRGPLIVARGTASNPGADWMLNLPMAPEVSSPSSARVVDGLMLAGSTTVVDVNRGEQVRYSCAEADPSNCVVAGVARVPGRGLVLQIGNATVVTDLSGRELRRHTGDGYGNPVGGVAAAGTYFVYPGTAFAFDSGAKLWELPTEDGYPWTILAVHGGVVFAARQTGPTVGRSGAPTVYGAFDLVTGERLPGIPDDVGSTASVIFADGTIVMDARGLSQQEPALVATDMRTGRQVWRTATTKASYVRPTREGMLAFDFDTVTYYAWQ